MHPAQGEVKIVLSSLPNCQHAKAGSVHVKRRRGWYPARAIRVGGRRAKLRTVKARLMLYHTKDLTAGTCPHAATRALDTLETVQLVMTTQTVSLVARGLRGLS